MNFYHAFKMGLRVTSVMVVLTTTISFAWTPTGSMRTARASHTATVLPSGLVLVAGGAGDNNNALASSELYNSASGSWTATGNMNVARVSARAVLLPNGKVLTMGGCISNDCQSGTTRSA